MLTLAPALRETRVLDGVNAGRDALAGRASRRSRSARTRIAPPRACARPEDLYAAPAREAIGQHLAGWLRRHRVTPFELLHRADLAARLEACEGELSAALYDAALAQAAARGAALEPIRRDLDRLFRQTVDRIASNDPDIGYRLGAAVAGRLGRLSNWKDKLEAILDLLDAAPSDGAPASVSLRVLRQPLTDIMAGQGDLDEILGRHLTLGDQLMVLVQIASAPALAMVTADTTLGWTVPRLSGLGARLAVVLHGRAAFARTRRAIAGRVLSVLASEARLWPDDPVREVEGVKTLAALLTVSDRLVDRDAINAALTGRWRRLAGAPFVEARLALCESPVEAAEVLIDMAEAASGRASAEALGRHLLCVLADRPFERAARFSLEPAGVSLRRLAGLASRVRASALRAETRAVAERRLRRLSAIIEVESAAFQA